MSPPVVQGLPGLSIQDAILGPHEVAIFFGSQSGTAECFAEDIQEEASKYGITAEVYDLRSFTAEAFSEKKIVILVVATYGDGEPTDNAVDFHRWTMNPNSAGALAGQRFCVMGLGDMNYTRFCQMGKDIDLNLERLGSKRIYDLGIGDDSQDIAEDFNKWKEGGLWDALKLAIKVVEAEGGFLEMSNAKKQQKCETAQLPLYLFVGQEEKDGAAKDIAECFVDKLKEKGFDAPTIQQLSDRKACEVVKRMPKRGFALVIADSCPEGLCSAGKKLVRNMTVELDKQGLKEKGIRYSVLTVANSKCGSSASALRHQIEQNSAPLGKAFDRAGATPVFKVPSYLDAGIDDSMHVLDEVCSALRAVSSEPAPVEEGKSAKVESIMTKALGFNVSDFAQAGPRTVFLCTGDEAREAAHAITKVMRARCSVEDAALVSMAGAARQQTHVVLVVDCSADGLSDGARGLATQLSAAPAAVQAQLQKLKFALLTVVCTDVGNAGERANANAARTEIARAVEPISQNLVKCGAACVASSCLDLQDANDATIADVCSTIKSGFGMPSDQPQVGGHSASISASPAAAVPEADAPPPGMTEVRLASSVAGLPGEAEGEPADVVSRFYFEAEECKVLKVRQLRQKPTPEDGLSTVEIEVEASGKLKEYALGGTLSVLPENDIEDVHRLLSLFSLQPDDLKKSLTFVAGAGTKLKRPFPTPCTLEKALTRYCDLARPPTKKMLAALQPNMKDVEARERLAALLKDDDVLKSMQSPSLCCKMHEFWALLGVHSLDLGEFLLHCPRLKAREFTIASSPKASPGKISLCVSLTSHEQTDLGSFHQMIHSKGFSSANVKEPSRCQRFFGVCSAWMNRRLKVGDMVLAKQRPSALRLPEKDVPIIMVGAGAGLAPFKGFWDDLRKGSQKAPAVLFFGCRHPEKDWLFKDEMNMAVKLNAGCGALARMQVGPKRPLAALYTAFSRPEQAAEKRYVQDRLREQAGTVKTCMENDGIVFICGSTAMGNSVLEALGETIEGGAATVESFRKQGRIVAEFWG
jgi:sulfite reductase alpha subunit-like flavoprotein